MKKFLFSIIAFIFLQTVFAQCLPDRHSTSWYDGWVSCTASQSPNPERGISHWIMYNFGEPYCLTTSTLWNSNDPAHLEYGLQGYAVDYSADGTVWTTLGTFSAEKASGSPFYEGIPGPDFEEAIAQYVLITSLSNYGGNCYGFSELKINLGSLPNGISENKQTAVVTYPNPFKEKLNIKFFGNSGNQLVSIYISDMAGRIVYSRTGILLKLSSEISLENSEMKLAPGIYSLNISSDSGTKTIKVIKI